MNKSELSVWLCHETDRRLPFTGTSTRWQQYTLVERRQIMDFLKALKHCRIYESDFDLAGHKNL